MYDGSYERVGDIDIVVEGVCSYFFRKGGRPVHVCISGCTT